MTRYGDLIETSNSEVETFLDCGRKWWLLYHRGLRPKVEAPVGPLNIGSRTHKALEEGYSTPGRERAMMEVLAQSIRDDYPLARELGVVEEFEKEVELVLIMLEGFVEWAAEEGLDAGWEVVSHEQVVRSPAMDFAGTPVVLKGKLDQIVRRQADGSLWMRDWKTTKDRKPVMISFGRQLKTYLALLALTEPDALVSGGQFVFLRKVKRSARAEPPFYMSEDMYVSTEEMASFWRQTVAILGRMVRTTLALEAGGDHHELAPPRPNRDCSWRCPFYAVCPMFDDGSRVEDLLSASYVEIDPYSYYEEDPDVTDEQETK